MSEGAAARLKAIMEFTELGSGYKLAMRDLEIRGAGNVLGAEQHGHMDKVGYELYAKLLKEELTGETQSVPELDIQANAYISEKENQELKFALGETDNTHDLLVAQMKASTSLQYTVALRDKFLESYKELMNMQI